MSNYVKLFESLDLTRKVNLIRLWRGNTYLFSTNRPASDASSSGSVSDSEDGGLQVTENNLGGLTSTQNLIDTPQSTDGEGALIKSSGQRIKSSTMEIINTGHIQPGIKTFFCFFLICFIILPELHISIFV